MGFVCIYLAISDTGLEDLLRLLMDELVPIHHSVPVADSAFVARCFGVSAKKTRFSALWIHGTFLQNCTCSDKH